MRVALDASPLDQPWATGVEKAFLALLRALAEQPGDHEFLLVAPRAPRLLSLPSDPRFRVCVLDRSARTLWRERLVPAFAHKERIDLWHSPVQALPLILDRPKVATVHELSWFETSGVEDEGSLPVRRMHAYVVAKAADRIVCVSNRTLKNFVRLHPESADRCRVVHHCVEPRFFEARGDAARLTERYGIPAFKPYLLTVGRALRRKGLPLALKAFRVFLDRTGNPHHLVLAGPRNACLEDVASQARRLGLGSRVHLTGYVKEEDLPMLYAGAAALLVPSESEGFGLPVLEAMAAGTPVVANAAASLPEVAGDAALLTDFRKPQDAARSIIEALGPQREEWIGRGRARAARFPPSLLATRMLDLWQGLAG